MQERSAVVVGPNQVRAALLLRFAYCFSVTGPMLLIRNGLPVASCYARENLADYFPVGASAAAFQHGSK